MSTQAGSAWSWLTCAAAKEWYDQSLPTIVNCFGVLLHEECSHISSRIQEFSSTPVVPIQPANPGQIERALFDVQARYTARIQNSEHKGKPLQLLIIILPDVKGSYGIQNPDSKIDKVIWLLGSLTRFCIHRKYQTSVWNRVGNCVAMLSAKASIKTWYAVSWKRGP